MIPGCFGLICLVGSALGLLLWVCCLGPGPGQAPKRINEKKWEPRPRQGVPQKEALEKARRDQGEAEKRVEAIGPRKVQRREPEMGVIQQFRVSCQAGLHRL